MSERPSSWRSSLTLPAADSVSVIICLPSIATVPTVPPLDRRSAPDLEIRDLAPRESQKVLGADREHGVRRPGGGPDHGVGHEIAIHEDLESLRVCERRRPPDRETGRVPSLFGRRLPDIL